MVPKMRMQPFLQLSQDWLGALPPCVRDYLEILRGFAGQPFYMMFRAEPYLCREMIELLDEGFDPRIWFFRCLALWHRKLLALLLPPVQSFVCRGEEQLRRGVRTPPPPKSVFHLSC